MKKRVHLWSSPRNISTALMYSFAQRSDTTVVDEPLYAFYLTHGQPGGEHPGHDEVLATQSNDPDVLVKTVLQSNDYPTPVVVYKQMTHHLLHFDRAFMEDALHVLLIRDPRHILASYTKVIHTPGPEDIGLPQQLELAQYLEKKGLLRGVVDASVLLQNPETALKTLCHKLELPFESAMLQWPAGAHPADGVWAKYWYGNVHQSTGFQPYQHKEIELPPHLEALAQHCMPMYETLLKLLEA